MQLEQQTETLSIKCYSHNIHRIQGSKTGNKINRCQSSSP